MADADGFIYFPAALAARDARLFWLLALELYRAGLLAECDGLLASDWSELIPDEDCEEIASRLCLLAFEADDLERAQTISEGFAPNRHALYFQRLRDCAKALPSSRRCVGWMLSQKLLGAGLDGFKDALREGHVELARALREPTAAEAEAVFFELAELLSKEALGLLIFHCPALVRFKALRHALDAGCLDEALCFLAWKLEEPRDKARLRMPEGDPSLLPALFGAALAKGRFGLAKKLLEWNGSLAFERLSPKELPPLGGSPIKLDGALILSPSDCACLYLQESLARALSKLGAPPPAPPKIEALLGAVGKKIDARAGSGKAWAADRLASCRALIKSAWREG
jgi:hypothetical protein